MLFDLERIFTVAPGSVVDAENVGHALQEQVLPVLRHHYDTFIEHVPGGKPGATPATYVLAVGYADGARHLGEDEITKVRERVARWVELERRALDELSG